MKECADRDMQYFQGICIASESSGDNDASLWINIDKNNDKVIHVDEVQNPSIHNAENRRKDTPVFPPFLYYIVLTHTGGGHFNIKNNVTVHTLISYWHHIPII